MRTKLKKDRRHLTILDDDTIPRPLQRSTPREVTLNGSGWVSAICAVALLLGGIVGGPLLALKLVEDSERAARLQAAGVSVDAQVTEVRRKSGKNAEVTIAYRYSTGGQEFANRLRVRKHDRIAATVKTGDRIGVRHLPSEPGRSWPDGYGPRERPVWPAALLPAVGVPSALGIVWLLRRQKRLLEDGRVAMARVTSVRKKSKHENLWRVDYSWTLPNGAVRSAHVDRAAEPAATGYLPVVYDRDRPEHHSEYPFSLVRLK